MKDRELLERLRKVESIPVKVYGQDGETICFEVQVGLAGVMVPREGKRGKTQLGGQGGKCMEKRLTTARQWCEAKNDLENEFGYSHIWCRLNAIENILGEEYDLEQLRQLVKTTQTGRCKRCRYSRQPSRQTQLYGEPGTLTCHHGRATEETSTKMIFAAILR